MPLYTSAEIKAKIIALDERITKAETAQEYQAGVGVGLKRGLVGDMYRERQRLEKLYAEVEGQEAGVGNTALVQFEAPS
ncbi:MAG: hypothetical protein ACYDHF_06320 [Candidatus Cryosericum sp.]